MRMPNRADDTVRRKKGEANCEGRKKMEVQEAQVNELSARATFALDTRKEISCFKKKMTSTQIHIVTQGSGRELGEGLHEGMGE